MCTLFGITKEEIKKTLIDLDDMGCVHHPELEVTKFDKEVHIKVLVFVEDEYWAHQLGCRLTSHKDAKTRKRSYRRFLWLPEEPISMNVSYLAQPWVFYKLIGYMWTSTSPFFNYEEYKQYSCLNLVLPTIPPTPISTLKTNETDIDIEEKNNVWSKESLVQWSEMSKTEEGCLALLQNQPSLPVRFEECTGSSCLLSRVRPIGRKLRFDLLTFLDNHIIVAKPSNSDDRMKSFTYWSLGPVGLFQDLLLIQKLLLGPNCIKIFDFVFIDNRYKRFFEVAAKEVEESIKTNVVNDIVKENVQEESGMITSTIAIKVTKKESNVTLEGSKLVLDKDMLLLQTKMSQSTSDMVGNLNGFDLIRKLMSIEDENLHDNIMKEINQKQFAEELLRLVYLIDFVRAHGGTVRSLRLFCSLTDYFKMSDQVPEIKGDLCASVDFLDDISVKEFGKVGEKIGKRYVPKMDMAKNDTSVCMFLSAYYGATCTKIMSKSHTWIDSNEKYRLKKQKQELFMMFIKFVLVCLIIFAIATTWSGQMVVI